MERSNESRPPRHMRELQHLHKLSAIWFRIRRVVLLNKHLGSISWLVGLVSCPVFASVLGGHLSQAGVQTTVRVNAFFVSLCEFHVVSGSCCVLSTASCGIPKRNQAARIPVWQLRSVCTTRPPVGSAIDRSRCGMGWQGDAEVREKLWKGLPEETAEWQIPLLPHRLAGMSSSGLAGLAFQFRWCLAWLRQRLDATIQCLAAAIFRGRTDSEGRCFFCDVRCKQRQYKDMFMYIFR